MSETHRCFVIMPFRPELHYFYLFLKTHLESTFPLSVARADDQVRTIPMIEKIKEMIREADFVIVDISGRNANVFYELGVAQALEKDVILLTSDEIGETPSDVRHMELIRYRLDDDVQFRAKIDNAVSHVLAPRYDGLYKKAISFLNDFQKELGTNVEAASAEEFAKRLVGVRAFDDPDQEIEYFLPKVIKNQFDASVNARVYGWINRRRS